jgi:hypothetical protein
VTKHRAAGRNFGTQQLLVVCCCRCEHHATRPAPCLVVVLLATLLERRSPRMSQAALAVSGAAGETSLLEVAGVATTSGCVCTSLPSVASVRLRHNSSIEAAGDSTSGLERTAQID